MKCKSVFVFTMGFFAATLLMFSDSAEARKWNFSAGQGKVNPRVMEHFISLSENTGSIRKIPTITFRPGEKLYFYYKIGPLQCKNGSGAPFKTRLTIKKGARTVKDFGWHDSNAANQSQMNGNVRLAYYHSARWNLHLQSNIIAGNYTAIVEHRDINSGKILRMRYPFKIDTTGDGS